MSNPYLSEIRILAFNYAPKGWALCNGQTLAISQNQALFSLLGTNYGGNGVSTFQLPNLQGRLPVHFGTGPGLSTYNLGQATGTETVTILSNTMPSHTHTLNVTAASATTGTIGTGVLPAKPTVANAELYATPAAPSGGTLYPAAVTTSNGGAPHENRMPSLALIFAIALQGIFPSRN